MTDYLTKRSLIIAVALTAGIFVGSVGWYLNTSSADIEPESKAEIYNFIKDTYVSQKDFELALVKERPVHTHTEFGAISKNFTSLRVASISTLYEQS